MARVGVSITKTTSFRGVAQEFSNTYYYDTPLPVVESIADNLIDNIVAKEKPMHGANVTFKYARCWSAGGTNQENNMIKQKPLSGTGTNAAVVNDAQDKERAFLVRIRAGQDSKGRPVYLRKWWHLEIGAAGGGTITNPVLANTAQLQAGTKNQLVTWMNDFKQITSLPQNFTLVGPNGRAVTGETTAHPYLEHHQLGDMWRGA